MSNQTFDFCNTSRVAEELPPQEQPTMSMNGWPFTSKPKVPYQREFKVTLDGLKWYLNVGGTALDETTDTTRNVGRLLRFYRDHRLWDSFLYNHEYLGIIRVRFSKPVTVPKAKGDTGGKLDSVEVNLVEHSPVF